MNKSKIKTVALIGPPGSGKSTLLQNIAKDIADVSVVSFGELFRRRAETDPSLRKIYITAAKNGTRFPDDVVVSMMDDILEEIDPSKKYTILESFPKTAQQVHFLQRKTSLVAAFELVVTDDSELVKRIINRSKSSGRIEDNREIALKRIRDYHEQADQLKLALGNKKVIQIDASADKMNVAKAVADRLSCIQG